MRSDFAGTVSGPGGRFLKSTAPGGRAAREPAWGTVFGGRVANGPGAP